MEDLGHWHFEGDGEVSANPAAVSSRVHDLESPNHGDACSTRSTHQRISTDTSIDDEVLNAENTSVEAESDLSEDGKKRVNKKAFGICSGIFGAGFTAGFFLNNFKHDIFGAAAKDEVNLTLIYALVITLFIFVCSVQLRSASGRNGNRGHLTAVACTMVGGMIIGAGGIMSTWMDNSTFSDVPVPEFIMIGGAFIAVFCFMISLFHPIKGADMFEKGNVGASVNQIAVGIGSIVTGILALLFVGRMIALHFYGVSNGDLLRDSDDIKTCIFFGGIVALCMMYAVIYNIYRKCK